MSFLNTDKILNNSFNGCIISQFKGVHKRLNLIERPETYLTLLRSDYGCNSKTTSTKRKLNNLKKCRLIYDDIIPSKNGRLKLFYIFEKEYQIVITKENVYYCDKIKYKDNSIFLIDCYILNKMNWVNVKDVKINNGEILKCF